MASIDLEALIPNNVGLASDRRLQKALEKWQPNYLKWWNDMGPDGFQGDDVYLRTAISTEPGGWANFDYVKMPDYRWGIFLADAEPDRVIPFGDHAGKPVWHQVPGEYRNMLRRIIVTQGDTEPASVEQQRQLAKTAPSLYDMRNLFQVNVEEGRHLWQMVYLLHAFFGRDGREEADELLMRRSGDADKPRILDAFNEPCEEWLSFFCFTMFTDRDGKFQLAALAESAFDPLSRSCRFMLTEEAHHLFVGEKGLERIFRRSAQLTKLDPNDDAFAQGGVRLEVLQKYVNYWFSYSLDLFGSEISTNAADTFSSGVKGRFREAKKYTEHNLLNEVLNIEVFEDGRIKTQEYAMRNALNEVLRIDYREDCERVVKRWNKALEQEGVDFRVSLPHTRFFRRQGLYAHQEFAPDGTPITHAEWEQRQTDWLPTDEDRAQVMAVMGKVTEAGKMANWIAAPARGVDGKKKQFEYVRFN
ncbi:MAG: benzoyl-CoA 2,3-dioxygenase component B [Kiritimatiellia bacterium]|jgi:benzoyl-CoA 2,3-dioxygenase component B